MVMNKAMLADIREALEMASATAAAAYVKGNGGAELALKANNALRCLKQLEEAEKCNGWSNWETWNVKLWLDNEQGTYCDVRDLIRDNTLDDGSAAEALKDYCEQLCFGDEAPASMATDLLRGALSDVIWQEIAAAYAEELVDENGEA